MKQLLFLLLSLSLMMTGCDLINGGGNNGDDEEPKEPQFSFTVKRSSKFPNLPALQSFVLGQSGSKWLLFGGRTNGFHGFGGTESFPFKQANKYMYAYDEATQKLDSLPLASLPKQIREQFESSNMLATQVGDYLYVVGGYGQTAPGTGDSTYVTHPILSRVNVPEAIEAITTTNLDRLGGGTILFIEDDFFRSTGGEIFMLDDRTFYLVLGHNFEGTYGGGDVTQTYLDSIRIFKLQEGDDSIELNEESIQYLSDNKPPATSQFHRRDLIVVPRIQTGGEDVGLAIYGGVFTPGNNGRPYLNPIFINAGPNPSFNIDLNYQQPANVYSAANVRMYSKQFDLNYTTILGGIGDSSDVNSADFTKSILTVIRDNQKRVTRDQFNPTGFSAFVGSEAQFIPADDVPMFQEPYQIIDFDAISKGNTTLGYMYGGIISKAPKWNATDNPTQASDVVYEIVINKK